MDSNKDSWFLLLNCPLTQSFSLSQLYHRVIVYRYSTIYILQLLQVPSEHHVTSILITLAETIYNILYKIWDPKYHSWYNDYAYSRKEEIFPFSKVSKLALVSMQPSSQCVPLF